MPIKRSPTKIVPATSAVSAERGGDKVFGYRAPGAPGDSIFGALRQPPPLQRSRTLLLQLSRLHTTARAARARTPVAA